MTRFTLSAGLAVNDRPHSFIAIFRQWPIKIRSIAAARAPSLSRLSLNDGRRFDVIWSAAIEVRGSLRGLWIRRVSCGTPFFVKVIVSR